MREETRKRLERAIWLERAKKASLGLLGIAVAGAFIAYQNLDLRIENTQVAGIVDGIDPFVSQTRNGDGVNVGVKLHDGRHVKVIALKSNEPHIGDRISVVEHHHGTGRVTYTMR
jgi:hypothetical protein